MGAWHPESDEFDQEDAPLDGLNLAIDFGAETDLSEMFIALTRKLQERFNIDRGLLVIREAGSTRFMATSTFSDRKIRKNLSLRIPTPSSLFEKVAEQGETFSEDFCDLFSGNSFEKKLLMDDDAQSYILLPLKHEGQIVGLLGYSSQTPLAFTTLENTDLENLTSMLARRISHTLSQAPQPDQFPF